MTIDTRQLRYFIAVAEEGHFGRAADRLLIAQPPLSQQIKQLEKSLGTTLLSRTTRSVELTPAGELLLGRGRGILEDLDAVEANIKRVGEGLQGILHLGFTGTATYALMPRVVRQAAQAFPGLALDVSGENLTPSLVSGLETKRLDIAVLRPPFASADIEHTVVTTEKMVAAVAAESPFAQKDELVMADLQDQEFVGYPPNSAVQQAVDSAWNKREIAPHYIQNVSETSTLLSLVAAGVGVALVPESSTSIQIGGTMFIPVRDAPNVDLAIAWRRGETSAAVLRFIPFLQEIITSA
jgi:DNA-binding transcriptional LysR family regulator